MLVEIACKLPRSHKFKNKHNFLYSSSSECSLTHEHNVHVDNPTHSCSLNKRYERGNE
jgi:hypothetical protein